MAPVWDNKEKKKKKEKKEKKRKNQSDSGHEVESNISSKKDRKRIRKEEKSRKQKKKETGESDKGEHPYQQPPPKDGTFQKAFYKESMKTSGISSEDVVKFYEKNEMNVTGSKCSNYNPIIDFINAECFPRKVMKHCDKFEKPSPIQSQCWPILASGRDIIGIAQTGSGKTLAFTVPGLIHILDVISKTKKVEFGHPILLVVAPTRELAMQISEVTADAGKDCGIKSICIYGGTSKHEQRNEIKRQKIHVCVATPGRLKDFIQESTLKLSRVSYLVLDEADRMLDEGFEQDVRYIIENVHIERQIAMFSATWPRSIQQLANEFLMDPVKVTCGSEDLVANRNVKQYVEVVEEFSRDAKIHLLLRKYHNKSRSNRILIFVLYKKEADRVDRMLKNKGWNCVAIHGNIGQAQRFEAVEKFKSGKVPLLIATDVAARGLDIEDIEYVINYSFPLTIEDYVHRIGRTGRAGKSGISHTFFTQHDKPRAGELVNLLREAQQPIPEELLKFGTHVKKKEHKLYGAFAKNIDMTKKATKIIFD